MAQGNVYIPADTTLINFDNDTIQEFEGGTITISPVNKKAVITHKAKTISFNVNKTTVTNKSEGSALNQKSVGSVKTNSATVEVDKKRVSGFNWNYLWWILLLLIIPIWRFRKKLFGF